MNPNQGLEPAVDALTAWFSTVSTEVSTLARNVTAVLEHNLIGKEKVDRAALAGLDDLASDVLTRNSFAVGAGTFLATETVDEGSRPMEWWSRQASGAIGRLKFDLTPGSHRYYEYEKLPFFSTAVATGKQTLWGPYIDYLGFEEYILTVSAPFWVRGTFMGVVGCDIRLRDLEPLIMPHLRLIHGDAALINASNRVILGNSGMYLVGERIKADSAHQHRLALKVPHLGLALIYSSQR